MELKNQFTVSIEFKERKFFTVKKTELCVYEDTKSFALFVADERIVRDTTEVVLVCTELLKQFNRAVKKEFSKASLDINFYSYNDGHATNFYRLGMFHQYNDRTYRKYVGTAIQETYEYQYINTVKDMECEIMSNIQSLMNKLKAE
jgi:hypothetical protein